MLRSSSLLAEDAELRLELGSLPVRACVHVRENEQVRLRNRVRASAHGI